MSENTGAVPHFDVKTVRDSILGDNLINTKRRTESGYSDYRIVVSAKKQYIGKRSLDLILGSFSILLFALLYPIIFLGIKFSSSGPVLFKQLRTGMNGHRFTCYKFRTMHMIQKKTKDGEPDITSKGDSRIFWFGSLLRKTNLDELPQIFNVLNGEMSLIGPRPYPVEECKYWNNTFDDFYYRYMVKPGVTGLAQVTGFRGGTLEVDHMRKRLDKDLIYVQKQSFKLDVQIIVSTIKQMILFKTNAH